MAYWSAKALSRAGVWMLPLAVAVAGCTEASSTPADASPDEAAGASVMVHSADPSFSTAEKDRLREICGLGAPGGRYRSTIVCNSAEAADPQIRAIVGKPRSLAGTINPSVLVASEMMESINRSVVVSIISTNTRVSERDVRKVLDELDLMYLKNTERSREGSELSRRGGLDIQNR